MSARQHGFGEQRTTTDKEVSVLEYIQVLYWYAHLVGSVKLRKKLQLTGLLGSGNAIVVGLPFSFSLASEIASATTLKLATAFGHMSGWKSIRDSILKSAGSIKLLTGLSFCQTEPDLLIDWMELSRSGSIQARLFTQRDITFHPKVLLIETPEKRFAVIGSGNLSGGGFLGNIECSLFSEDEAVFKQADAWFDRLFYDDDFTSTLRAPDIRRYRKSFDAAKQKNEQAQALQRQAELEFAERQHATLGRWKQAVDGAIHFFRSKQF